MLSDFTIKQLTCITELETHTAKEATAKRSYSLRSVTMVAVPKQVAENSLDGMGCKASR